MNHEHTEAAAANAGERAAATAQSTRPGVLRRVTHFVDSRAERALDVAWAELRREPYVGMAIAGGLALVAGTYVGVPELAIAIGAGYFAYQVLKLHLPPSQALRSAAKLEHEIAA